MHACFVSETVVLNPQNFLLELSVSVCVCGGVGVGVCVCVGGTAGILTFSAPLAHSNGGLWPPAPLAAQEEVTAETR